MAGTARWLVVVFLDGGNEWQAMVLQTQGNIGDGLLRRERRPLPTPGPGQLRLRVAACGVCHTDLHVCAGELPPRPLPIIPGHQIVGYIDALGPEHDAALRLGQRVGVAWLHATCGSCRFCRTGRENLCRLARFTGYDADGGYASHAIAPAAFVHPLPERYGDAQAAPLLCAGIIGWRALRRAGVQPGERVGLFGFGASAHLTLQVLTAWGCPVAVWSRGESHRRLARALGASWAGGYEAAAPWPLERAIVFTPAGDTVAQALGHLDAGGVVAIASVHLSPLPPLDHDRLLSGEREIRSVTAATRQDAADFLRVAAALPLEVAVTRFPLAQAEQALVELRRGHIDGAAVLEPD